MPVSVQGFPDNLALAHWINSLQAELAYLQGLLGNKPGSVGTVTGQVDSQQTTNARGQTHPRGHTQAKYSTCARPCPQHWWQPVSPINPCIMGVRSRSLDRNMGAPEFFHNLNTHLCSFQGWDSGGTCPLTSVPQGGPAMSPTPLKYQSYRHHYHFGKIN